MPEIPRTKFNSPWTVAVIEAALNDVSSAKGSSESLTAALNAMRAEINSLSGGVHLKGAVDYYSDLPASPSEGDAYTVRYQGTSGTDPLGIEYAWANYQGTPQWIPIGVDPSVFAKATDEAEDRAALVDLVDGGAKNGFIITGTSGVTAQVTYTVDKIAGTINASGSPSSTSVYRAGYAVCKAGEKYIVSGCPAGGDVAKGYSIRVVKTTDDTVVWETGSSSEFEYEGTVYIDIYVRAGASVSGVFKIMLCPRIFWEISQAYQPYRPSWQEMWDAIQALQSGGNRALTMQMQPTESTEPDEPEESEAR